MGFAQEKRPNEIIDLSADFTSALIDGDALILGNCDVTVADALTDANTTATILVSGSKALSGAVLSCQVKAGADGETHIVTFKTGDTLQGKRYEATVNLVITSYPASDNIFCTRDDVKHRLKIPDADTSEDVLIDEQILSATGYIRTRTGRDFILRPYVELIAPQCERPLVRLRLSEWPVRAVSRIVVSRYGLDQLVFTDPTLWRVEREGYVQWTWAGTIAGGYFLPEPNTNEVTYRAGYDGIPADIREACKQIACIFYRGIGREGLSSERIGSYAWSRRGMASSLPRSMERELEDLFVEGVIDRYSRIDLDLP